MSGVVNNRNDAYKHSSEQEKKDESLTGSKNLVKIIQRRLQQLDNIACCVEYEPDMSLRIAGAPAVRLPNGKLVIAPDLRCLLKDGRTFWVEVKDKCQRFYKPDTGADLHQILGFYQINKILHQPVLMVFQDAKEEECLVKNANETQKKKFKQRWLKFEGEPYGGWIKECLTLDKNNNYPLVAFEKSRTVPIFIFYFSVYKLKKLDFTNILSTINDSCRIDTEIAAYRKMVDNGMELCNKKDLEMLSVENLTLVTTNTAYKDVPIVDVLDEHLIKLAIHKKSTYKTQAMREIWRRYTKYMNEN